METTSGTWRRVKIEQAIRILRLGSFEIWWHALVAILDRITWKSAQMALGTLKNEWTASWDASTVTRKQILITLMLQLLSSDAKFCNGYQFLVLGVLRYPTWSLFLSIANWRCTASLGSYRCPVSPTARSRTFSGVLHHNLPFFVLLAIFFGQNLNVFDT